MAELLAGFGADLPTATRLLIDLDVWLLVLPLIGIIPAVLLLANKELPARTIQNLFGWSIAVAVLALMLVGLAVWTMYAPIFKLGEVV